MIAKSQLSKLPEKQQQILIGGLMGRSYICSIKPTDHTVSSSYYYMQSPKSEEEYLLSKALELKELARKKAIYYKQNVVGWRSKPNPDLWNEVYPLVYNSERKKYANMDFLNLFRDVALTIWLLDSGELDETRQFLKLHTQVFGYEGNLVIQNYFDQYGMQTDVIRHNRTYLLHFSPQATRRFLSIAYPIIPEFMLPRYFD